MILYIFFVCFSSPRAPRSCHHHPCNCRHPWFPSVFSFDRCCLVEAIPPFLHQRRRPTTITGLYPPASLRRAARCLPASATHYATQQPHAHQCCPRTGRRAGRQGHSAPHAPRASSVRRRLRARYLAAEAEIIKMADAAQPRPSAGPRRKCGDTTKECRECECSRHS